MTSHSIFDLCRRRPRLRKSSLVIGFTVLIEGAMCEIESIFNLALMKTAMIWLDVVYGVVSQSTVTQAGNREQHHLVGKTQMANSQGFLQKA